MKYVTVLFCIVLTGCVTRYQLPPNTESATIKLSTADFKLMDKVRVQVYEDENCTQSTRGNRLAYFFMDMYDPKKGVVKKIAANKEFVFTYVLGKGTFCAVTSKFVPVPGGSYTSYFFGSEDRKCHVDLEELYRKENGEEGRRPVPSFRVLEKSCISNFTD